MKTVQKLEKLAKKIGLLHQRQVRATTDGEMLIGIPSSEGGVLGDLRFIPKEDGTYSVIFSPHLWLKKELAKGGFPIHERAKPTRKTRSVLQMCRSM